MGRCCRICGHQRPNEQFGGRGQRAIICLKCRRLPPEERRCQLLQQEIYGFLDQSNISKKNLQRLRQLEADNIDEVATLASLVKRIAEAKPAKRKRWKIIRQQHRDLFRSALDAGLVEPNCNEFDDLWASDDDFLDGDWFGVWIEARADEREPSFAWSRRDESTPK